MLSQTRAAKKKLGKLVAKFHDDHGVRFRKAADERLYTGTSEVCVAARKFRDEELKKQREASNNPVDKTNTAKATSDSPIAKKKKKNKKSVKPSDLRRLLKAAVHLDERNIFQHPVLRSQFSSEQVRCTRRITELYLLLACSLRCAVLCCAVLSN